MGGYRNCDNHESEIANFSSASTAQRIGGNEHKFAIGKRSMAGVAQLSLVACDNQLFSIVDASLVGHYM